MRRTDWLWGALALVSSGAGAAGFGGCTPKLSDCSEFPSTNCPGFGGGTAAASVGTTSSSIMTSTTTTTNGSTTTASSSSSGVPPQNCAGDPLTDATLVDDNCGVFVSTSGSSAGAGTQGSPLDQLSNALVQAKTQGKSFIFMCAEKYSESATTSLSSTVKLQIYGNLTNCQPSDGGTTSDAGEDGGLQIWTMGDATKEQNRAVITGPADAATLVLSGAGELDFYGLNVTSPNAGKLAGGNGLNGSSIAVYVNGATANFTNSDLTAGTAQAGVLPTDGSTTAATSGMPGNPGGNACSAAMVSGGASVTTACGAVTSVGGKGGDGDATLGNAGSAGQPTGSGMGGGGMSDVTCNGGGNGIGGASGTDGTPGAGATANFGILTSTSFIGTTGMAGTAGTTGQGGGGGGGETGSASICTPDGGTTNGGASGGSGGSGGCGGNPGGAGNGGGASIALVSDHATVTLKAVKLIAGAGGVGGRGGNPQVGGMGGSGGPGGTNGQTILKQGCPGGAGGNGGNGGAGGGGRGGHSIAMASSGPTLPSFDTNSLRGVTAAASGGPSGASKVTEPYGAPGISAMCWDFGKNASCP
jgi:hypothetical protein